MIKQYQNLTENTCGFIAQKEFDIVSDFLDKGYSEEEIKHFFNFMAMLAKAWKKPENKESSKVFS